MSPWRTAATTTGIGGALGLAAAVAAGADAEVLRVRSQ